MSSNATGIPQLYRWDTASGALTQLTFDPDGRIVGRLSPDGRWVTWLADTKGNEIGHWVVIPSSRRRARRPEPRPRAVCLGADRLQPRAAVGSRSSPPPTTGSRSGSASSPTTAGSAISGRSTTRPPTTTAIRPERGRTRSPPSRPAHRSTGLEYSLLTARHRARRAGPELWDGPGTGILVHAFAPGDDDRRLVATTNASGRERAFVWDAATGERRDLPADAPGGDILALDWSPDGSEILLCRIDQAEQRLLVWNLASDAIRVLDHPTGAVLGYLRGT